MTIDQTTNAKPRGLILGIAALALALAASGHAAPNQASAASGKSAGIEVSDARWAEASQATRLIGQPVFDQQGERIGEVRNVVRNSGTQQVSLVIERSGGQDLPGLTEQRSAERLRERQAGSGQQQPQLVVLPFNQAKLALQMPQQELAALPAYDEQRYEQVALAETRDSDASAPEQRSASAERPDNASSN